MACEIDEEDPSFCYIEGTDLDKTSANDISEVHENVWYRMKPPKPSTVMYSPFVSARQIDLVRNKLLGKSALKVEVKPKAVETPEQGKVCRREIIEQPSIKTKQSSVRFLNNSIYE